MSDFPFDSKILNRWDRAFVAFSLFRRSLENECVVYRWRGCRLSSSISLRYPHQAPQPFTRRILLKACVLSRRSYHIFSPPSNITLSSHSINRKERFSLHQQYSQTLYPHITSTPQHKLHTLLYYPAPPLPHAADTNPHTIIATLADIRERVTRSLPHRPKCAYKR